MKKISYVAILLAFGAIVTSRCASPQPHGIDIQAHRGGIGLMPENSIEAMINAVNLGVTTLELDLAVTADGKVVVSHDQYMNRNFVTLPDGGEIPEEMTKKYVIYKMDYDSLRRFDTGMRPHPKFPQQKKIPTYIPLLSELIDSVENYVARNNLPPINYNIEIKSMEGKDNKLTPHFEEFTDLTMAVLDPKELGDRLIIQCFDTRTLNYLHKTHPEVKLSYLVGVVAMRFEEQLERLDFVPYAYSPNYIMVNAEMVKSCADMGIKLIPWTVDEPEEIEKMVALGIDAIITNYPDRVLEIVNKNK